MNNDTSILSRNTSSILPNPCVNISNNNRTHYAESISPSNSMDYNENTKILETMYNNDNDINKNIYRYKFSKEFIEQLFSFSKTHQYDDRVGFKEAWKEWVKENNDLVELEIRRLKNLDYEGNVLDKMFKSARYYFRKKNSCLSIPKKRCLYLSISKEVLETMDKHISTTSGNVKPSDSFNEFCSTNQEILKDEIRRIIKEFELDNEDIKKKIKKTYKNRYFLYRN